MRIIKCDRCGKELENADRRFLYHLQYDFCDECKEIYDKIENEIGKKANEMRKECEEKIQEMANKRLRDFKLLEVKDEKESI